MYFNTQEEIITKIAKSLEKSLILRKKVIKNLASIVLGIILAKSTVVSKIAENLKEDFSKGKEESKIKKIKVSGQQDDVLKPSKMSSIIKVQKF